MCRIDGTRSAELLLRALPLGPDAVASNDDSVECEAPHLGLISEYDTKNTVRHETKCCCVSF